MKIDLNFKFQDHKSALKWGDVPTLKDVIEAGLEKYGLEGRIQDYLDELDWYHTPFKEKWAGRKFRCANTGEEVTIPDNVGEGDFFQFGESYIDVGRNNFYCRFGGNPVEISESKE